MIVETIMAGAGLLIPPAFDFIKKKFLGPKNDTTEATLSSLATTKPEIMDKFINATAELLKAKTMFFNRDVISNPSLWVINLRAAIRPISVVLFIPMRFSVCILSIFGIHVVDESCLGMLDMCITSWFGSRL